MQGGGLGRGRDQGRVRGLDHPWVRDQDTQSHKAGPQETLLNVELKYPSLSSPTKQGSRPAIPSAFPQQLLFLALFITSLPQMYSIFRIKFMKPVRTQPPSHHNSEQ